MQSPERSKRPRGTPTFQTPVRPYKRVPLRELAKGNLEPRRITAKPVSRLSKGESWSHEQIKALVEFVLLHCKGDTWPTRMPEAMWNAAGEFVKSRTGAEIARSGRACRFKVVGWLKKKFSTPKEAEQFYVCSTTRGVQTEYPPQFSSCETQTSPPQFSSCEAQTVITVKPSSETADIELRALSQGFSEICHNQFDLHVPDDFLIHAGTSMDNLAKNGRSNVLYSLAKGIGTMREDHSDSLFPVKRMPMGMVEYTTNFFSVENMNQVPRCPGDYRVWQQTMYCQFGQKWAKLHHGPMWKVSQSARSFSSQERMINQALVNIPALQESTLRRDIAASDISMDSKIQGSVLDEAARVHPNSWWWIKADGCDIVRGLGESISGEWSGDVNLDEGALESFYNEYRRRLEWVRCVGLEERKDDLESDLDIMKHEITDDVKFIGATLQNLNQEYESKLAEGKKGNEMFDLAWDVQELDNLNAKGRSLLVQFSVLKERVLDPDYDIIANNLARQLSDLREEMLSFVKRVTKYRRVAATHILIVMISPEERDSKPYALTVQCIAYKSIKDSEIRSICNTVIKEMISREMKVAGFVTNGEWNSLRSKGNTRPLSVFEVRSMARNKYTRMSVKAMLEMLTPIRGADGVVKAERCNPAISKEQLEEILVWKEEGCTMVDITTRLRLRTVPSGFQFHTWHQGKSETQVEELRSILAQFEYGFQIDHWESEGVPFRNHLHVPEDHPLTGYMFCEREDEGHVFKRIAGSLRRGCVESIQLEKFVEALQDPATGLTHPALSGVRKQSVEDVERLFGDGVIKFMEEHDYKSEAKYLRTVRNWRRAVDERGLPNALRTRYYKEFLDFIIEDLIPWHSSGNTDFRSLEVNRPINKVQGFTRETLIALAADIETRIWRSTLLESISLPPEHPRSSTSDDVECFFSILRDTVGKNFTLKQVYYGWRKVCLEFVKRMDPDLPFYYYTSSHQRFYEGDMPAFTEKPSKPKKTKRAPRRELIGTIGRRVSLPVRGSVSLRAEFHNIPVNLPPPPDVSSATRLASEHAYASSGPS